MAEIDLKEGAEWKLAQEIIAAYAKGDGNSVRDKQTTEGKDLCDYLVTIPWLKTAKISAPRDLRKMKAGFLGFRAE